LWNAVEYTIIDEGIRVYVGLTIKDLYILVNKYWYIKAFNKKRDCICRHFILSTIGGQAISDDRKNLWIESCTGMIHRLKLAKEHIDNHTLRNGNHYKEFRLILWKEEPIMIC
jgi:hypothetical protein